LDASKRNTPEGDHLDVLVALVEAWKRKHYPMDRPVEAIKYHMDQNELQPRDLIPFIGNRNCVHEVLTKPAKPPPMAGRKPEVLQLRE
jgi:HTH-type transcriptional regulator/antitoxin HigA